MAFCMFVLEERATWKDRFGLKSVDDRKKHGLILSDSLVGGREVFIAFLCFNCSRCGVLFGMWIV